VPPEPIADRLERLIGEQGPIPVSRYVEEALYGPDGFYMSGGHAGRRGDFLTAPEVGPLFGAVVARAIDLWWREAGEPATFVVHEWGAGPGTLARAVLAAAPAVLISGALRWHLIEHSDTQREQHPTHPQLSSSAEPPVGAADVVLANELLDNLPFDIWERGDTTHDNRWHSLLVDRRDAEGRFVLVRDDRPLDGAAVEALAQLPGISHLPEGTRIPWLGPAQRWLVDRCATGPDAHGRVVIIDYGAATSELAAREGGWLRTHVSHDGSSDWLRHPGSCDITTDVAFDQLAMAHAPHLDLRQDEWLRHHGIEMLVEEGKRVWEERAGVGDLAALRARSRVNESQALLDPTGMGAFRVLGWVPRRSPGDGVH